MDFSSQSPDFRLILESVPDCYLILKPDAPRFTIVAVSNTYTSATITKREEIIGRGLFEVFPDNPDEVGATGVKNLTASLGRVLSEKKLDTMAIQKYDIPRPESQGGGFEKRYWSPENSPVFDSNGTIVYIVHHVTDVTKYEEILQLYGSVGETGKNAFNQFTQLERFNKLMVEREVKMVELKREIEALKKKISAS